MNLIAKKFRVYNNITGKLVAEGSAKECCAIIGCSSSNFYYAAANNKTVCGGRWRVTEESIAPPKKVGAASDFEAILNWDKFVEPLRKKYGIPVYKAKPEVRG